MICADIFVFPLLYVCVYLCGWMWVVTCDAGAEEGKGHTTRKEKYEKRNMRSMTRIRKENLPVDGRCVW